MCAIAKVLCVDAIVPAAKRDKLELETRATALIKHTCLIVNSGSRSSMCMITVHSINPGPRLRLNRMPEPQHWSHIPLWQCTCRGIHLIAPTSQTRASSLAGTPSGFVLVVFRSAVHAELARQLLDQGLPIEDPSGICQLQPLHLACLPKVYDAEQVR
jgi:hypothetical protein